MSSRQIDGAVAYGGSFREGLKPDPLLTVSEWADRERILPPVSSAEPGQWRTSRTPYLREIMDCLSPSSPVQRVTFMKGSQIGATESGNNWIGYVIAMAPGPMLAVQPNLDMAKRFSKQRVQPTIRNTPALQGKVKDARVRDSGNTILVKQFPGGILVITGAESATSLRSMPARYLFMDEIDPYPDDCGGEGDPCGLAEARTSTFSSRKKIFETSTPTEAGRSRIERRYELSDKRRYFVPCPFCKGEQWLKWGQIVFEKDEKYRLTSPVRYKCEHCGEPIDERYKTWMLESGRWIAEAPGRGKPAGFFLSSLYSPLGWLSWDAIAQEFLDARKTRDVSALKVWTNTKLAEVWEEEGLVIDDGTLLSRREKYPASIPAGGLVLTIGVDIQADRIEASVDAWGKHEESWLIEYAIFRGSPETDLKVWEDLRILLDRSWDQELGLSLRIAAGCVDSGHATSQVYKFVRSLEHRRVYAVKGQGGKGLPVIRISEKRNKAGIKLGLVGVDTCKSLIYSRVMLPDFGPGYMHFPMSVGEDYFSGLTAEKRVIRKVRGKEIEEWVKVRARNEPLDCFVYSHAALDLLKIRDWDRLASNIERQVEKEKPGKEEEGPKTQGTEMPVPMRVPRKGWSATKW